MKILSIDASKYSLKWALFQFPQGEELASGMVEDIGKKKSLRRFHYQTLNDTKRVVALSHEKALSIILKDLLEFPVIESINEIKGIGHRIVAGGEYLKESTIIPTDEIGKTEKLGEYALLNNLTQVKMINLFQCLLPEILNIAVFDSSIYRKAQTNGYQTRISQVSINRKPFIRTLSNYVQDGQIIAEDVYDILGEKVRV